MSFEHTEIVALEATLYIKSCWRSAGVCESMDDIIYMVREPHNVQDRYAVAVKKTGIIVGH